ncbi:MAG: hypothetical protein PWQ94_2273 [Thermoanaerobacterium sp.]|nr:hypothetical protein [Thermoanaerobacterium sp.]
MLNPAPFKKSIEKLPVVDSVVVTVIVAVPLVSISVVGKLPEVEIVLACLFSNVQSPSLAFSTCALSMLSICLKES